MKLVVGLGNPGAQYEKTRHNVGFQVLDALARRVSPGAIARSKFHGAVIESDYQGEKVMLLKPTTFMNRSGTAVSEAVRFYKLSPTEELLVLVDDVALPCGSIRLRPDGGSGGHNGLADIEQRIGTDVYPRLRIGIDAPGQIPQSDYVLGRFREDQLTMLSGALTEAAVAAECWINHDISFCMNQFNRKHTA